MIHPPKPTKTNPPEFIAKLDSFLRNHDYRMGADTAGLRTERQNSLLEFATEKVFELAASFAGMHGGPTGTKEIASDTAAEVLQPFLQFTDLLGWKTSEIVLARSADDLSAEEFQLLIDVYLKLAVNASNALSIQKYGGILHVFPLFVFSGSVSSLAGVRDVVISKEKTGFLLHVYVNCCIVTLADGQIHWPSGTKLPKPLQELGALLPA